MLIVHCLLCLIKSLLTVSLDCVVEGQISCGVHEIIGSSPAPQ